MTTVLAVAFMLACGTLLVVLLMGEFMPVSHTPGPWRVADDLPSIKCQQVRAAIAKAETTR